MEQNVDSITTRVENTEGDITSLEQTIKGLTSRVTTSEGDITSLEQTASGLTTRITNAEGSISSIKTTVNGLSTRISTAEDDISSLEQSVSSITTRVSTAEGDISTLKQTTSSISATVSTKADKTGGSSSSFGWSLTSSGFTLYASGSTVLSVTSSGATITGTIKATSGTIGGFTISSSAIYKTKTSYSSTTSGVYLGTDGIGLGAGTFYVTSGGALTAKSGNIGGFTIGTSSIYKTKTAYSNTTAGVYLGTDGIGLGAGTFYVTSAGALTATSATITGTINATGGTFTNVIIAGSIYFNDTKSYYLNPNKNNSSWYIYLPKFRVDDTSAYFSGTLQAPGGTIGGFTIASNKIYKTKTSYNSSTAGVYIGTDGIGLGAGTFYVTSAGVLTASNVNITGGSIALGTSSNQNYLSMTSSRILFGVENDVFTQINWSGISNEYTAIFSEGTMTPEMR